MKYGFIPPEIKSEDYFLGSGKLGSQEINPSGDWRPYLPIFEHQRKEYETQACVSFGTLSALEMLHKFHYTVEPNYADRFLAKISNTDPNGGNTPNKVSQALRDGGCVQEEKWPFPQTLEEYYQEIPDHVKELGIKWLSEYEYGYEWVNKSRLKDALKRSPVGCAVFAWAQNDKGEYIKLGNPNHWVVLIAFDEFDRPVIWDSYEESVKTLEKNYDLEFPQIYVLKKKDPIKQTYYKASFYGKIWQLVKQYLLWT